MKTSWKSILFAVLLLAFGLSACVPLIGGTSPQQVVLQEINRSMEKQAALDNNSVQVRQTVDFQGKAFVFVTFDRQIEGRHESCEWVYSTQKTRWGTWVPSSGGGGCSGQISGPPQPATPLSMGGGTSSGGPNDPGYSEVYGVANHKDIVRVRVTWEDEKMQEVELVNGSYMAIREGSHQWNTVEGLDAAGNLVFANPPLEKAPGKQ